MKTRLLFPLAIVAVAAWLAGCTKQSSDVKPVSDAIAYYVKNIRPPYPVKGLTFLEVDAKLQTTEYTCGPAAVVSLLRFWGRDGDEMTIAKEMGTSTTTGTTPDQMTDWLNKNGFKASWHQEGSLELLQKNLSENIPTLVEWSDWGGHWVLVVGYDIRNPEDIMDDVIIFADPYDYYDDHRDGLTWFNAQRFYYMWYDALLFGKVMKKIYIQAVPVKRGTTAAN